MAAYLLSSQTVLDIAKKLNLPAERWLRAAAERRIIENDLCISAVVPMTVMHTVDLWISEARRRRGGNLAALGAMKRNAERFLGGFMQNERIIPMDHKIAERWGDLLDMDLVFADEDGGTYGAGSAEKVELATASVGRDGRPFIYVDRLQDAHALVPYSSSNVPLLSRLPWRRVSERSWRPLSNSGAKRRRLPRPVHGGVPEAVRRRGSKRIRERFDLIVGTSIGALLAAGFALGRPAADLCEAMVAHGPRIFARSPMTFPKRLFKGAPYDTKILEEAIDAVLTPDGANMRLNEIDQPLMITAVNYTQGSSTIFKSRGVAQSRASDARVKDAVLASAAAPTYFPLRKLATDQYADGGLIANAPDLLAITETIAARRAPPELIYLLSIGTAARRKGAALHERPLSPSIRRGSSFADWSKRSWRPRGSDRPLPSFWATDTCALMRSPPRIRWPPLPALTMRTTARLAR